MWRELVDWWWRTPLPFRVAVAMLAAVLATIAYAAVATG